jgi:F-type H+-transporting ATPase subunit b
MRIDWWTLALQTINVLILIWILGRFFFRPIMDIVTKRQQEANKLLGDAAHDRQEAADRLAEIDAARANITTERDQLIAAAVAAARDEKQNLLAQASEEIAKLHAQAEAAIARDRVAAEEQIIDRASDLSIDIARRLLTRFPHRDLLRAFVDDIGRKLRALPDEVRADLAAAAAKGRQIEVVTATSLSDEETHYVRGVLEKALDADLPLTFRSDPAIVAGVEIGGPNAIVRNSWHADLDRIRQELKS